MEVYADMIPKDTYDSSFFRAIINIHANEFQKAQQVGWFCCYFFQYYFIISEANKFVERLPFTMQYIL